MRTSRWRPKKRFCGSPMAQRLHSMRPIWSEAFRRWRWDKTSRKYFAATGKSVVITSLSMRQGELSLAGAGTLGVDQSGYPSGRIAFRIKRIDLLFENVKAIAHLSEEDAHTAKIFVDLLKNGSTDDSQIDLIAKDGKLYWGPFKVAELRPLF